MVFRSRFRSLFRRMSSPVNFSNYAKSYSAAVFSPKCIDLSKDEGAALNEVQKVLLAGGCIALPSDTVYGLITLLKFSSKLFFVKKRSPTKPVALFIHSPEVIKRYAEQTVNDELLKKLLPGKVTLLFRRIPDISDSFNFNTNLIAFRMPEDDFIQHLCKRFDEPLAQTSANLSGEPSAIKPEEFKAIWETLDMIVVNPEKQLDERREGSTIIDLSEPGTYHIQRDGCSLAYYEQILRDANLKPR